ncbi:MAG TPA: hypothetical protein VJR03_02875 [Nitrospira sp.]|nr:hypothetical protein [Nitrospira sp.]
MNDKIDKNIQRIIEIGAVLVVIGMGLNIVVMQTLGSFDAAAVILGLFLGFWAVVLGTGILVLSSGVLLIRRRQTVLEPMNQTGVASQPVLHSVGQRRLCTMH